MAQIHIGTNDLKSRTFIELFFGTSVLTIEPVMILYVRIVQIE